MRLLCRDENRVIDYLFNIWDHNYIENNKEIFSKIENGFEYVSGTDFVVFQQSLVEDGSVHRLGSNGFSMNI